MSKSSGGRRYLALFFPWLPAERLCRAAPPPDAPIVFAEKQRGALRLASVDPHAAALGLGPGMPLADARAQVGDLAVVPHDPVADAAWLDRLAQGCARYTPLVALDAPDGLILDIAGAAHLFGGEAELVADVEERMDRLGMTLRSALAGTADAARALARYQALPAPDEAAAVRRLPVAALGLEAEATTALVRAGLKTIGDLSGRPVAAIAARFGAEAANALRRLLGDAPSPLDPRIRPPPIVVERRFAEPLGSSAHAAAVLAELAAEAAVALGERGKGGRHFRATFFRSDGLARSIAIETGQPTRDADLVMRLFAERIDSLRDPIDPGFGFDMIRLAVPRIEALGAGQLRLEGGAANTAPGAAAVDELADRLATRLGRGRVRRLRSADTHIPEQAQLALPAVEAPPPTPWTATEPGEPPLRPFHLFDPPQPIEVIAEVPDGPPQRFRWRRTLHAVRRFEGPERIAAEWWRRRDNAGLTRDYYRVEDAQGRRYWLFRHGLYDEKPDPRWYIHGVFA
ncbi:nucleotidyltransferase [Sphingopyxis terrae subsp. terrae NBRC 15098]|uniref:DNA-directed DNA polymerase n=1 Tax=Sphingopyxis terrae subsp. terrae NBRC 15098 TaxID=1219058 RepID=A0A142VYN0_9SPHN|nr:MULTISPECIES: DNA polymerase Y family protein [Sphingopyxis]AMU94886.1 nucleotidyltransferase [Sphingopyxis terrae subsp. terrae NBRC 15098]QXF13531.1 DNA polymerase Y family protein [Sphingopyxis terrae subsp. terrae]